MDVTSRRVNEEEQSIDAVLDQISEKLLRANEKLAPLKNITP